MLLSVIACYRVLCLGSVARARKSKAGIKPACNHLQWVVLIHATLTTTKPALRAASSCR